MNTTLKTRTAALVAAAGLVVGGLTLPGASPAEAGSCKGKNSISAHTATDPYSGISQTVVDGYMNSCATSKLISDWDKYTSDPTHELVTLVPIAGEADLANNAIMKYGLKNMKKAASKGTGIEIHRTGSFVNAKAQ